VKYKAFDFNIYFYGDVNKLMGESYYERIGIFGANGRWGQIGYNASKMALETWHHDYRNTEYPNPMISSYSNGDYFAKKISYVRCRNITAGYTLPVSRNFVNKVRIYADITNPFILTNYTGVDPEMEGLTSWFPYPTSRGYSLGIDITF
jgi:hypothetical protein